MNGFESRRLGVEQLVGNAVDLLHYLRMTTWGSENSEKPSKDESDNNIGILNWSSAEKVFSFFGRQTRSKDVQTIGRSVMMDICAKIIQQLFKQDEQKHEKAL